jgi:hypothetical protein
MPKSRTMSDAEGEVRELTLDRLIGGGRGPSRALLLMRALASRVMRTTLDIDDPFLRDLKRLQRRGGKSLGRLVSDLHAQSLAAQRAVPDVPLPFNWTSASSASYVRDPLAN